MHERANADHDLHRRRRHQLAARLSRWRKEYEQSEGHALVGHRHVSLQIFDMRSDDMKLLGIVRVNSRAGRRRRAARRGGSLAILLALTLLSVAPAAAQELEPRAYSASPVGANFAGIAYQNSWGSLLFDPTVPITNSKASLNGITLAYGRTFSLGGAQALALVGMPYAWGSFSGQVASTDTNVTRSGVGDMRAKLSLNLIGGPALSPEAFARAAPPSVVAGVSLTVSAPTGQNYPSKLINIGSHRWGLKPEAGISYGWRRKWYGDLYGGAWFFSENSSFYPGTSRRQQDPLSSLQGHLSYTFARRSWAALDGTWFWGGASHTNGGPATARMDNKRVGVLLAIGVTSRQSIKIGYSYGASTRVGDNFGTVAVAYQRLWF